ncbi:MAG: hypothetical protein IT228_12020 [Flavobacteriales bacterium]|nr:hypothetical protein [Flavobacteriales bacterium]
MGVKVVGRQNKWRPWLLERWQWRTRSWNVGGSEKAMTPRGKLPNKTRYAVATNLRAPIPVIIAGTLVMIL